MQDHILRLLGVLVGSAGVFLFADGERILGVLAVGLGTVGILMTVHPSFRLFSEPTPRGGSWFRTGDAEAAHRRGEARLEQALQRGPGGRRSQPGPQDVPPPPQSRRLTQVPRRRD